jgi:hypothetical protein
MAPAFHVEAKNLNLYSNGNTNPGPMPLHNPAGKHRQDCKYRQDRKFRIEYNKNEENTAGMKKT